MEDRLRRYMRLQAVAHRLALQMLFDGQTRVVTVSKSIEEAHELQEMVSREVEKLNAGRKERKGYGATKA